MTYFCRRIVLRSRCSIVGAMYWYNATPKDNETLSRMPVNGIDEHEQCIKCVDPKPSPPENTGNIYQIGELVWVKPPNCRCTTRFNKGVVDGVINPQTVLVNGTPHHVKDLRRCDESAVTEEDESDTLSNSKSGGHGVF